MYQIRLSHHLSRTSFTRFLNNIVIADSWKVILTMLQDIWKVINEDLEACEFDLFHEVYGTVSSLKENAELSSYSSSMVS